MENIWLAMTGTATSLVAIGTLIRGVMWCTGRWRRRVSWRSLNSFERDIVWGVAVTGVGTIAIDYDHAHTNTEQPMAFVRKDGTKITDSDAIEGTGLHLNPFYVINLESLQDKDLVRPYSKVLLKLTPSTYTARPRLEQFIQSHKKALGSHEPHVIKKINFVPVVIPRRRR